MEVCSQPVPQGTAVPFLTPSEVLAQLRVNIKTLYRLIGDGELPAVRVGRQWRVRPHDLEAWLLHHRNGANQRPDHARGTPGDAPDINHACHPERQGVLLEKDIA